MKEEISELEIVLFFSTQFDRGDKLSIASRLIKASSGVFNEKNLTITDNIPESISGPIWLTLTSATRDWILSISDQRLSIKWLRVNKDKPTATTIDDIIEFASNFTIHPVLGKKTVQRLGFITQYLLDINPNIFKKKIFLTELAGNITDFQIALVKKTKLEIALAKRECNIRVNSTNVIYTTREQTKSSPGVLLSVDVNTVMDLDLDLPLSEATSGLGVLSKETLFENLESSFGLH